MDFVFSNHSLQQMKQRGISQQQAEIVLAHPQQVIKENGKEIYQSIVNFENEGDYLLRIFVNATVNPKLVITVYRTSKISKYYEG